MSPGPAKQFDRDEALGRALELFWCQGYEQTGMNELVTHMGIGRQSLYDTFGSKRQLFLEALEQYQGAMIQPVLDILAAPSSPLANLRGLFDFWLGMAEEHGSKGCLLGRATMSFGSSDADVATRLRRGFERLEEGLFRNFERAKELGELRAEADSRSLARTVVTLGQGLALLSTVQEGTEFARQTLMSFLDLLPTPA